MSTTVGAVILFTSRLEACARFYRAVGLDLRDERHEDGPAHLACDIDGIHVAVFEADGDGQAPAFREAGCSFIGFAVDSVDDALAAVAGLGAPVRQEPARYPWGRRAVVDDPDGRPVELFEPAS
jgi:lactoylglutathione lyase